MNTHFYSIAPKLTESDLTSMALATVAILCVTLIILAGVWFFDREQERRMRVLEMNKEVPW